MKQTKKQKQEKMFKNNNIRKEIVRMIFDAEFNNKPLDYSVLKAKCKELSGGGYVANLKAVNFSSKYRQVGYMK